MGITGQADQDPRHPSPDAADRTRPRRSVGPVRRVARAAILTAHNLAFDRAFLGSATATGTELRHEGELCTLTLARRLDPERRYSHRLGDLCGRHGVPLERAHDALEDAVATARLLPHLFEEAGVETLGELETLLAPRHPNDPADDPTGPIPRPSS
ncbi:MAG: 3'-5' exonuclease [Ilumatobacteraceae bacterium]